MCRTDGSFLDSDGSHVFPLSQLWIEGSAKHKVSGEIKWSAERGLTFSVAADGQRSLNEFLEDNGKPNRGVGTHDSVRSLPLWVGQITDGCRVTFRGLVENNRVSIPAGRKETWPKSVISGRGVYARVSIRRESELANWFDTEPTTRLYCRGIDIHAWPIHETLSYSIGDRQMQRSRSSLLLSKSLGLTLYRGSEKFGSPASAWLSYSVSGDSEPDWYDENCEAVRALLSFLFGRRISFLWKDEFTNDKELSRLYFGWHAQTVTRDTGQQLVPIGTTIEAFKHSKKVVSQLPELLAEFVPLRAAFDLEWIAAPVWYAHGGFLEDKLALACVSLERLSTAFDDFRRASGNFESKPLMTREQATRLLDAFKAVLRTVASESQISDEALQVLGRKIENLHQTPNSDRLNGMFEDLGIVLSKEEAKVVDHRNRCLHGRATLKAANTPESIEDEVQRFDTLRTLIARAILSLLKYSGPYIDYSERPPTGNFPIKSMNASSSGSLCS